MSWRAQPSEAGFSSVLETKKNFQVKLELMMYYSRLALLKGVSRVLGTLLAKR